MKGKQLSLFPEEELFRNNGRSEYVPFVSEVETFNETFGKPNNYEPTIPEEKEWKFVYDFILEELEEYREASNEEISWKFWMLCATLLMFPLGTVLCYMALKIRYGQHIKRYKQVICQKLVQLKKRPYRVSAKELRSKVRPVILKKLRRDGTLSTELEIEK